jgi:hypothetical protein
MQKFISLIIKHLTKKSTQICEKVLTQGLNYCNLAKRNETRYNMKGLPYKQAEYINEATKVRNLHATSRRIRSQEKRDKAEHIAFVIAHKEYLKERGILSKAETKAKREQYKREREIRRSRAKRM